MDISTNPSEKKPCTNHTITRAEWDATFELTTSAWWRPTKIASWIGSYPVWLTRQEIACHFDRIQALPLSSPTSQSLSSIWLWFARLWIRESIMHIHASLSIHLNSHSRLPVEHMLPLTVKTLAVRPIIHSFYSFVLLADGCFYCGAAKFIHNF